MVDKENYANKGIFFIFDSFFLSVNFFSIFLRGRGKEDKVLWKGSTSMVMGSYNFSL